MVRCIIAIESDQDNVVGWYPSLSLDWIKSGVGQAPQSLASDNHLLRSFLKESSATSTSAGNQEEDYDHLISDDDEFKQMDVEDDPTSTKSSDTGNTAGNSEEDYDNLISDDDECKEIPMDVENDSTSTKSDDFDNSVGFAASTPSPEIPHVSKGMCIGCIAYPANESF